MPTKKTSAFGSQSRWERNAESWATFVRGNHDIVRRFLINPWVRTIAKELRGKSVLDAGCGEGGYSRILAAAGAHVTGVDFSAGMIRAAQEYEKSKPFGIRYLVGNLVDLGIKQASFDGVVCIMTLMALRDLKQAMAEIAHVLRPRGPVFLVINHPCFNRPDNGNYFTPARLVWRFYPNQAAPTLFFHRPLERYVEAMCSAGISVTRLLEPRLSSRAIKLSKRWRYLRRIPGVLVIEGMRLNGEKNYGFNGRKGE